jgi:DNA-binding XRE family transcriptional regulator
MPFYHIKPSIIADNLFKIRVKAKIAQQNAANTLNISLHCYKEWENGKVDFKVSKLNLICETFVVELHDLVNTPPHPQILR